MRINLSVRSARPPMTKKEAGSWLNRSPPLQELVDLWDSLETCTWMLCSSDEEIRPAMYTHPLISGALLKYVTWCVYVTHYRFHFCRKGLGCTGILLVREGEINFSCRALLFEGPLNLKLKRYKISMTQSGDWIFIPSYAVKSTFALTHLNRWPTSRMD